MLLCNYIIYLFIDLSNFINQAESYNSKCSDADVVKDFLLLSGNGHEILQLVKTMPTADLQGVRFLILSSLFIYILMNKLLLKWNLLLHCN